MVVARLSHRSERDLQETPLRGEILTRVGLAEYARSLADQHRVAPSRRGTSRLLARFEENNRLLEQAYFALSEAAEKKENLSSGAAWLLDNYHIIKAQVVEIRRDFPRGYYQSLPKLTEGELKNYPRVYHLALEIIMHTDATVDSDLVAAFIEAYQSRAVLASGELWAIPIMLRFALIENLRRLTVHTLEVTKQAKFAEDFVEEIVGPETRSSTDSLLILAQKLNENPGSLPLGAVSLMRRLRQKGSKSALTLQWLEARLKELGFDPEEMARTEHYAQAANQASIGNSVTSLKRIGDINWQDWFEAVSLVHRTLLEDPAGAYVRCDFITRDHYRHRIERLARAMRKSELHIAQATIAFVNAYRTRFIDRKEREEPASENNTGSEIDVGDDSQQRYFHIGYYLVGKGTRELEKHLQWQRPLLVGIQEFLNTHAFACYSMTIFILALVLAGALFAQIMAIGGTLLEAFAGAILFVIPLSELATHIVQWLETHSSKPTPLPKFDFEAGIPTRYRTIVTVQTIFHDQKAITRAVEGLEVRFLANDDPNLFFAILADLRDAPDAQMPKDVELIAYAEALMTELNERHFLSGEGRFFLLFRKRIWNESQRTFMGWERKRGKISEFNRLILGAEDTSFHVHVGDSALLRTMKFVITLDSDSGLPRGVARKLVGTLAHPLNRPVFNEATNIVCEGYGVIQPRVSVGFASANASRFASIFSGDIGLDPYTQLVSDVYQDLFQEGSYIGKGIYDVQAFERALHARVPDNTMLSHDLFEGCFARVALATDIEIFDDFPARYDVYMQRLYRWVRGDWQLLPWLRGRIPNALGKRYRSPIADIGRWKLFDNLRRSLVAPTCFLFLCFAFTVLPGSPLQWLLLIALVIAFPVYANVANALVNPPRDVAARGYVRGIGQDLLKQSLQALLTFSFLPYQTFLMVRAITVTLWRMFFSKRNLLEWEPAYYAENRLRGGMQSFFREMSLGVFLVGLITAAICIWAPQQLFFSIPCLLLWAGSPIIAWWLSRPRPTVDATLSNADRARLLQIGAETWRYFDQLLTAEHNYLIPDNIQLEPRVVVAERTSPTNISLSILSVISAYDLGILPLHVVMEQLTHTFTTLNRLERFHGHFLNWYQTKTLQPLHPRYVSMVDSGNLVGHLLAARTAFLRFPDSPIVAHTHWEYIRLRCRALGEALPYNEVKLRTHASTLHKVLASVPRNTKDVLIGLTAIETFLQGSTGDSASSMQLSREMVEEFQDSVKEFQRIAESIKLLHWYTAFEKNTAAIEQCIAMLPTSEQALSQTRFQQLQNTLQQKLPTPRILREISTFLLTVLQPVLIDRRHSAARGENESGLFSLIDELQNVAALLKTATEQNEFLIDTAHKLISEVEFSFLYDPKKELFSIGYHLESGQRDNSFYDLLASEARLGSFVAVASGVIPQKHWFHLGRALVAVPGSAALISWSGTMFEYLMPLLVMRDYAGTLLAKTSQAVVQAQQEYARFRGVPWGISESAYSVVDFEKTYQYKAFGVPSLGLKRGLADDLVVSPYSTFLALMVDPIAALENMSALEKLGMRGKFGFYEAIDYTPERLSAEEGSHIIRSFLAHHQGMTLVAINNVLHGGIMVERFHADPRVRATELLLQERFPRHVEISTSTQGEICSTKIEDDEERVSRGERLTTPHLKYPRTRVLSNGRYTLMVDDAGNGFSAMGSELMLTRWREDAVAGQYGNYIFVRDLDTGKVWSVAYQPTRVEPETYEVLFNPDKIEFIRRDFGILLHTAITVSPEDNVEVREVTLTNLSNRKRNLELTSYAEVALASARADSAHPAFSKMFIETQYLPDFEALIFARRPRSKEEEKLFLMHMVTLKRCWAATEYESSRALFLGRGNTIGAPAIFENGAHLSSTTGAVLDPIFSLRARIELEESETEAVVFSTGFAKSYEAITTLAQRYHDLHSVTRAFEMAWSHNNIELRREEYSIRQVHAFQRLITAILYDIDIFRGEAEARTTNRLTQSGFWRFGVSGDLAIVFLRVTDPEQIGVVRELLLAHQYARSRGILFDLVILNEYPGGYFQNFQEELEFLVRASSLRGATEQKGGIHLRTQIQLSSEEVTLLEATARVVLWGEKGALSTQLKFGDKGGESSYRRKNTSDEGESRAEDSHTTRSNTVQASAVRPQFEFFNGVGGFVDQGRRYQIELADRKLPPLPWANIIANPHFGFAVSESGGGYTWSDNSRENRLTPWNNDPVSDQAGEVLYIRDTDQGSYWAPTPRPIVTRRQFQVRHGFGHSRFLTTKRGIESALTLSGSPTEKVKWWHLQLTNRTDKARRLEVYLYLEWVLGIQREESVRYLVTNFDKHANFLHASNHYNNEFAGRVVLVGSNLPVVSYTTNRREFLGRHGDVSAPRALEGSEPLTLANLISPGRVPIELSGKVGSGFDSCAALKVEVSLTPGEEREILFYMSEVATLDEARKQAPRFRSIKVRNIELDRVKELWDTNLSSVQIKTPDRAFDIVLNGWFLYQTLACRMYGRSALYQSGGAIGFRDQLQDSLALLFSNASLTRAQILLHAARQFAEGDVQHWWHPPTGRGVRTRISDDYLWLPYAVERYIEATGDFGILDEQIPFIEGPKLEEYQMEAYIVPTVSSRVASLYEHCTRALEHGFTIGAHGLPLMGAGDWNDGMNEVGKEGKGESVWLGWFLSYCLTKFLNVCAKRNDTERAARYAEKAKQLVAAVELHGWDGEWYRRAFFDDGTPLGSASNLECKIDSLSQSWSVIAGSGDTGRRVTAMAAVKRELVRSADKLVCLLTPPFDRHSADTAAIEPGYIKGYLPGVRENGGQYTHAAAWVVMANALQGHGQEAFDLFSMINPINHTRNTKEVQRYQAEPYVLCGDVYSSAPHAGRAGWSWYTGSAGWMYQVGIEHIMGLKIFAEHFTVDPCVPPTWKEFSFTYRTHNVLYKIEIRNPEGVEKGVATIQLNNQLVADHKIYYTRSEVAREESVTVTMGIRQ
jgi:cyclic beta-1,2-glucan synthetase